MFNVIEKAGEAETGTKALEFSGGSVAEQEAVLGRGIHVEMPSWAEHAPLISFQTHSSVYFLFMKTPLPIKIASLKLQSSVEHI